MTDPRTAKAIKRFLFFPPTNPRFLSNTPRVVVFRAKDSSSSITAATSYNVCVGDATSGFADSSLKLVGDVPETRKE